MRAITAESVTKGHPDLLADTCADAVLDSALEQDSHSKVACEVLLTGNTAIVAGEITTRAQLNLPSIVHSVWPGCEVLSKVQSQAPALTQTVDQGLAGDQGICLGYATDETPEMLPTPIALAHRLARRLEEVRESGLLIYLRADGKTQVSVEYEGDKPVRIATVVVSSQHDSAIDLDVLRSDLREHVVSILPLMDEDTRVLVNAQAGRFEIGGPAGDTGLTGRKLALLYGPGMSAGGALSGKDPSKLDRSGAYMLRHIAKAVVSSGRAKRCQIEAAYCIGVADPVALHVETFGTGLAFDVEAYVRTFPLTPEGIIEYLDLRRPIYRQTACYGHFGNAAFPWEQAPHPRGTKLAKGETYEGCKQKQWN
jgi:S-adenosylmethionine synthetase